MVFTPMRQHLDEYPLVIVHNYLESFQKFLSRSGDENTLLDRRFNGDQALFWLGGPKLVISSAPIENADLLKRRWGYQAARTLSPQVMSHSLSQDIIREAPLRQEIVEFSGDQKKIALIPYATTPEFLQLAEALQKKDGLDVLLPESTNAENLWIKDYLDSKVGFRSVMTLSNSKEKKLKCPPGYICADLDQAIEAADWFRRSGKGCVVKASIGGSGVGNLFLPLNTIPDKASIANQVHQNDFLAEDVFVVEELILSPESISPSVEYYVPPKGKGRPQFTYLCNQLFESSGRFAGVVISKELEKFSWWPDFHNQSQLIARQLQEIGYTGYFDLDAIVDQNGNCFLVEINSRRTGGTYAHEFMEYNFGLDYGKRFTVLSQNKRSSGSLRKLEELEHTLSSLLYPMGGTQTGVIVMLTSMLSQGYFGYLIIGREINEVTHLQEQMLKRINAD
jgi:hypothetical protein